MIIAPIIGLPLIVHMYEYINLMYLIIIKVALPAPPPILLPLLIHWAISVTVYLTNCLFNYLFHCNYL